MYNEKALTVEKIENGLLLCIKVPFKKKRDMEEKGEYPMDYEHYGKKEIYAKDASDLAKKIETLIPMLDMEFGGESEFESAFKMVDV